MVACVSTNCVKGPIRSVCSASVMKSPGGTWPKGRVLPPQQRLHRVRRTVAETSQRLVVDLQLIGADRVRQLAEQTEPAALRA